MSAKQITVPLEVYVRLQELASLAAYSYRDEQGSEENTAYDRPWDLLVPRTAPPCSMRTARSSPKRQSSTSPSCRSSPRNSCSSSRHSWTRTVRHPSPPPHAPRFALQPAPHSADRGAAGEPAYCRAHREGILRRRATAPPHLRRAPRRDGLHERHGLTYELLLDIIESPASTVFKKARKKTATAAKSPSTRMKRKATRWCSTP